MLIPDPSGIRTSHAIYDAAGNIKGVVEAGAPTEKMIELHSIFDTAEEAVEYAKSLGFDDIRVTRTKTKVESLAKAREAKKKRGEQ